MQKPLKTSFNRELLTMFLPVLSLAGFGLFLNNSRTSTPMSVANPGATMDHWRLTLRPNQTRTATVMDTSGVRLIFQGQPCVGVLNSTLQVAGAGGSTYSGGGSSISSGKVLSFTSLYAQGVARMNFSGYKLKWENKGMKLTIGQQVFDLSGGKHTIFVSPGGVAKIDLGRPYRAL